MADTLLPPPQSTPDIAGAAGRDSGEGLPAKFGKYTLLRKLAVGGMAELFLAIQRSVAGFEKLIVIKRILPAMNQDRAFIDMLLHEARIAATLSHPNIVQIFDVGQVDGIYFIAMEHVHGEDLRSIVRQMKKKAVNDFPLEHAISIVLGMCAGLAYAHDKRDLDGTALNIVHRDISPQNVVVTFTGDVKIVDFGIAKSDARLNNEDSKSGKLKGKVPYMSPEQARGEPIDWRSDIFAAGVMLFELTTGKRLFKGQSEFETLKLICERDYPLPSQVREGYPIELEYIVMKALSKDRAKRYQSAREMQAALEEFVRRERIPVSTIALHGFMQSLFEDKLLDQKEALVQGKQLADIIERQSGGLRDGADSQHEVSENRLSASILSTPAASRTVTGLDGIRRRRSAGMRIVAVALGVVVAGGALTYFARGRDGSPAVDARGAAIAAASSANNGSVDVRSEPAGAAIWVDGDLRPEVTPARIAHLPTGRPLDVKVSKDGFEQARQAVTLSEKAPSAAVDLPLKKGLVSIEVAWKQAHADGLKLSLNLDGKPYSGPVIDGVSSGDPHTLVVTAPGYAEQSMTFSGAPFEAKHFDITLERGDASARARHERAAGAATASPAASGKLNVGASGGWCNVIVDGVARGATPVAGIELPPGSHKVSCTPPDGKPPQTASVPVTAEGTTRYRFTLAN
jgi:serine/threonine protein kinase